MAHMSSTCHLRWPHPGLLPLPPSAPPTWPLTQRPPPRRPPRIPSPVGASGRCLGMGLGVSNAFWTLLGMEGYKKWFKWSLRHSFRDIYTLHLLYMIFKSSYIIWAFVAKCRINLQPILETHNRPTFGTVSMYIPLEILLLLRLVEHHINP